MSIIRILPSETANRIAAGEVVERPASVVKELLENAIDAGARRIVVAAQEGGRKLVQVSDDGCGMDRDDALLCLEAHATSKIHDAYDIDRICTLGFRGEALPSIAAVSQFHLQTRRPEDVSGTEIIVHGGEIRSVGECGCAPGTNVRVRNLFFNLPARRKFLRTPQTEDAHIQETVLTQALAHPGVAIELHLNDQRLLQVGGDHDLGARVAMLLGRDAYEGMLPVDYREGALAVVGFVARPGLTRTRRRDQRAFVNGRPAEAEAIYQGLREAYQSLTVPGRYPPAVLYLTLPADLVDVNVHPTKREVRFRDGRLVAAVVAAAARQALRALVGGRAATLPPPPSSPPTFIVPAADAVIDLLGRQQALHGLGSTPIDPLAAWASLPPGLPPAVAPESAGPPPAVDQKQPTTSGGADEWAGQEAAVGERPALEALRVLGFLSDRQVVAVGQAGLVLLDYRAAVERILFEKLLRSARQREGARQPLLLPVTLELPPADAILLGKTASQFNLLGFEIEPFGGGTFMVTAVPASFPQENIAGMVRDMLDDLREHATVTSRPDDLRIAQAAARRAARGFDRPDEDGIRRLLAELARTQMPYATPAGKPVLINIPHAEIDRRFGNRRDA